MIMLSWTLLMISNAITVPNTTLECKIYDFSPNKFPSTYSINFQYCYGTLGKDKDIYIFMTP